ncbi:MAG: DUF302 domain-containing protein [Gammaproteobacteria bacterium]|nr:DUF302 domain-containing protein [Gammaproteobacteria bacterium]
MKPNLILYNLESCPFCSLIKKKLEILGLPVLLVPVPVNGDDRKEVIEISGQKSIPVFVDDGKVITSSKEIMEYLDTEYGTGSPVPLPSSDIGWRTIIKGSYDDVYAKTIKAFQEAGFGVLTEINVQATLKKKLNIDMAPNTILGMCQPQLAYDSMMAEPDTGLLLPCNVVIREESENSFHVTAIRSVKLFSLVGREDILNFSMKINKMIRAAMAGLEK